jgi:hypothetical protein
MRKQQSYIAYILLAVFVIGGLGYLLLPYLFESKNTTSASSENTGASAPLFVKEGEVTFLRKNGDTIRKIDVEIAADDAEQARGLMYRPYMPDSVGILFIFDNAEPQAFWMKNTHLLLDIIYVGADKKIVSIQKYARPYSEESLPSFADALYVVEVITDRYGIEAGDQIRF